jgi:hypothetical protein
LFNLEAEVVDGDDGSKSFGEALYLDGCHKATVRCEPPDHIASETGSPLCQRAEISGIDLHRMGEGAATAIGFGRRRRGFRQRGGNIHRGPGDCPGSAHIGQITTYAKVLVVVHQDIEQSQNGGYSVVFGSGEYSSQPWQFGKYRFDHWPRSCADRTIYSRCCPGSIRPLS